MKTTTNKNNTITAASIDPKLYGLGLHRKFRKAVNDKVHATKFVITKVEIRYNKKSLVKFGEGINYLTHHYENVERQKLEKKTWTKEENYIMFLEAQKRLWIEEKYTTDIFFKGMKEYLSLSIEDALKHDEWMIRLFAIMDKRLGKRSLLKLEKEINTYPKMLQIIYKIRMKEEGFKDYQDFNI